MNINITVTLTANPELLAVLQGFCKSATPSANGSKKGKQAEKSTTVVDKTGSISNTEPEAEDNTDEENSTGDTSTVTDTATITLEQVQAAVHKKSQEGKKDGVKKILTDMGVAKVSALTSEQYSDFLAKVIAL